MREREIPTPDLPIVLTPPSWRSQLRCVLRQAGEALAVMGSIVAVGLGTIVAL